MSAKKERAPRHRKKTTQRVEKRASLMESVWKKEKEGGKGGGKRKLSTSSSTKHGNLKGKVAFHLDLSQWGEVKVKRGRRPKGQKQWE